MYLLTVGSHFLIQGAIKRNINKIKIAFVKSMSAAFEQSFKPGFIQCLDFYYMQISVDNGLHI